MGGNEDMRKKLVRTAYTAFNNGDLEQVLSSLHPEVEIVGADEVGRLNENEVWRGHEEALRFYEGLRNEIGLRWIEIVKLEVNGDVVVATVLLHGEHKASGWSGAVPAVRRHTFDGDLIRRVETYRKGWDLPSFEEKDDPSSS